MFYVNFHCSFWMHWWYFYWFSFVPASIEILRCFNEFHINDCFMSTYIAVIGVNVAFALCQLPLQLSDVLLNFISTLFYVNFHCSFWMCWWDFDYLCFISTSIAIIKCIHINFSFMSTSIESTSMHVNNNYMNFDLCGLPLLWPPHVVW